MIKQILKGWKKLEDVINSCRYRIKRGVIFSPTDTDVDHEDRVLEKNSIFTMDEREILSGINTFCPNASPVVLEILREVYTEDELRMVAGFFLKIRLLSKHVQSNSNYSDQQVQFLTDSLNEFTREVFESIDFYDVIDSRSFLSKCRIFSGVSLGILIDNLNDYLESNITSLVANGYYFGDKKIVKYYYAQLGDFLFNCDAKTSNGLV